MNSRYESLVKQVQAAIAAKRSTNSLPMDMADRGKLLQEMCAASAAMERARIAAGLPPSEPVPFPESTIQFFRQQARKFHDRSKVD